MWPKVIISPIQYAQGFSQLNPNRTETIRNCIVLSATWWTQQQRQTEGQRDRETEMEVYISSALFRQTEKGGAEEMAAFSFTAAAIDLHCSLSNQSQSGELQTICKCVYELFACLPKAILLTVSKWQKALDLHLTAASHKSIWPSIDWAQI